MTSEKKKQRLREASKRWRTRHPEKFRSAVQKWRAKNRGTYRGYMRKWGVARRAEDPLFRIVQNARRRVRRALKGARTRKSTATLLLIGCSARELRAHLEAQFRPGMTWENYGPVWHVDHRKPCARFDLTDPAQQRTCFHFSNLQPLFAEENLKKGSKI